MAYYDALTAKWPSVTGASTAAKLLNINGQTVTGAVPTAFTVTGPDIYNSLALAEWNLLTVVQQANVRDIIGLNGPLQAGAGTMVQAMLLSIFAAGTATRANLVALARATAQPWWQANGYLGPINNNDLTAAGGLT